MTTARFSTLFCLAALAAGSCGKPAAPPAAQPGVASGTQDARDPINELVAPAHRRMEAEFESLRLATEPAGPSTDPEAGPSPPAAAGVAPEGIWITPEGDGPRLALVLESGTATVWVLAKNLSTTSRDDSPRPGAADGKRTLTVKLVPGVAAFGVPDELAFTFDGRSLTVTIPDGPAKGEHRLHPVRRKPTPPRAVVTFTGTPLYRVTVKAVGGGGASASVNGVTTSLVKRSPDERPIAVFKLADATELFVTSPAGTDWPAAEAKDAAADAAKRPTAVVVRGTLAVTDSPIDRILSVKKKVPSLVADRVVPLTDANRRDSPGENTVVVEGVVAKGDARVGTKESGWAVRDGGGLLPLVLDPGVPAPAAETRVRVTGTILFEAETLAVSVKGIEVVK